LALEEAGVGGSIPSRGTKYKNTSQSEVFLLFILEEGIEGYPSARMRRVPHVNAGRKRGTQDFEGGTKVTGEKIPSRGTQKKKRSCVSFFLAERQFSEYSVIRKLITE